MPASEDLLSELGMKITDVAGRRFFRGRGCETCNNTGYKGRVGLYELMIVNDTIRDMIMQNASVDDLRKTAVGFGMITLRESGMSKAYEGVTTLEEVVRETILEA